MASIGVKIHAIVTVDDIIAAIENRAAGQGTWFPALIPTGWALW